MNRFLKFLFPAGCVLMALQLTAQNPFSRGVNLTGWFQVDNARQIQFTKYTKDDLANIKSLGCDVIRLPINLHYMTNGAPDYTIDPIFFDFLDQVVDWAEELQINLLLDNHSFDPNTDTQPSVENILMKVWPQMAEHYKNRSKYVYYEVLNEPHGISTTDWCRIQQHVIDTIRTIDQTHTIIVGPSGFNSYNELKNMPVYTDSNLIYTFHFYDPFMFTHQGATWVSYMQDLAGVPFPYDAARMPATPASAKGTWVESSLNSYKNDGTVAAVKDWLDIAVNFKNSRNVVLYCGEYGVFIPNSPDADRVYWYDVVRKYLEANGIPWTTWDYQGGFGLFKKGSNELFDYDLNTGVLNSLGLNVPPQKMYQLKPDTVPFAIYTDYLGHSISDASYAGGGTIDFYNATPESGMYSIYWTGSPRYNGLVFNFRPVKDLSLLVANNYELDLWIKGDTPGTKFQIRFIDTKTSDPADHPWRNSYDIDGTKVTWNNSWQHLKIPLKSFRETGSWDNGSWYNPAGKFDWKAIDRLEFISEFSDLGTQQIWFDDIRINGIPVNAELSLRESGLQPATIFPNPVANRATIRYFLPKQSLTDISIFDLSGKKIATLSHQVQPAGTHEIRLDASQIQALQNGVYFCKVASVSGTEILKVILQKN